MKKFLSLLLVIAITATTLSITAIADDTALTACYGWYEAIHIEWSGDSNAEAAVVSYKPSSSESYTNIDSELVREEEGKGVADVVGISSGVYDIKVTTADGSILEQNNIAVARHDRSGYGWYEASGGLGGYKEDGTPKSNAQIVYVTNENKNTVKLGSYTGLANIIKKASSNAPLIIRIIGTVDTQTRDADGTKTTDKNNGVIALDGLTDNELSNDSYFNMMDVSEKSNITVEGIGTNAQIEKWGFTFSKCNSIEVRNLVFTKYPEDACSFQGSSSNNKKYKNYWVHNNYFKVGENKYDLTDEQDKHEGDGSSDFKGCRNITYSYNIFEKCHKTSLHGGGDSSLQYNSTWHHNYFNQSSSRMPLTRQVNLHSYNNYFYKGSRCIDARASAWVLSEANYFDSSTGILTSTSSQYGDPIVKSYNDVFDNSKTSDSAKTLTITDDRTLKLSESLGANKNKNPYPNFDTDASVFYYDSANKASDVDYLTSAEEAKNDAVKAAGTMSADKVVSAYLPDDYNIDTTESSSESTTETSTETTTETSTETTTETSTETTTETSTETTTESTTETTTETSTETTTETSSETTEATTESTETTTDAILYGDVDNNGAVNRTDLVSFAKYFAGVVSDIFEKAADVTHDGLVGRTDLVKLAKYFAGAVSDLTK